MIEDEFSMYCKGNLQYSCSRPTIAISDVPLLLFGKKKAELQSAEAQTLTTKSKPCKLVGLPVAKYDIAEDKVRFFNKTGLSKKRWVVAKEFPVYEITGMNHLGNWLSLSWNNGVYSFILPKDGSFAKLVHQITELQEAHQKNLQKTQQAELRKSELRTVLGASLPIADGLFDVLMGLHKKRVNWLQIENYLQALSGTFNFKPQTLTPLTLDFSKIALAVQNQVAKETAQEAFALLGIIWAYFSQLGSQTDLTDSVPNSGQVRNVVLAYFTLNDLWFAKTIGGADTQNEFDAFKGQLADLAAQTPFRANADEFLPVVENAANSWDIWDARILFSERLKQL
ncbi:MAG: hypothetical protein LBH79_08245 [Nitrososphaerota archaeon]|nr:hypothetical protein [Nitrososphaerota archaeon]